MLGIYARTSRDNPLEVISTIDQQIKAGIEFAIKNGLEYQVYADKGISGYKISEEEESDPFNNRPQFTQLVNDIKNKKIDSVWVWEHSRISRNQYASAFIFNIFQKHKITLYEKDKEFNLSDPTNQMLRQILDAVAQYERQLIVGRTTRGLYNAIDSGRRAHAKFFGYRRVGRDKNNNIVWEPVESELEQIRKWYAQYKEGKSLRSIILSQIDGTDKLETAVLLQRATKLNRFLSHAEYTGYNLNMKGLEILHKFEKCEIDNLQALKNKEYWVKSIAYNVQIISIEEWVDIRERLQQNKLVRASRDVNKRRAEKSLATGLIKCGCCGLYYYHYHMHYKSAKLNDFVDFYYYYHHKSFGNERCSNRPKSLDVKRIDNIFEAFVLYFFALFDNYQTAMQEDLESRNIELMKIEETQKSFDKEIAQIKRQIEKLNLALESTDDVKAITVLAARISDCEERIKTIAEKKAENFIVLSKKNEEMEKLQSNMYFYSMADQILNFHKKYNIEEKRTTLMKIIDEAIVFGKYLLIRNANRVFVFDTKKNYGFPEDAYNVFEAVRDIDSVSVLNLTLNIPKMLTRKEAQEFFHKNNINYDSNVRVFLV